MSWLDIVADISDGSQSTRTVVISVILELCFPAKICSLS